MQVYPPGHRRPPGYRADSANPRDKRGGFGYNNTFKPKGAPMDYRINELIERIKALEEELETEFEKKT